MTFYGFEFRLAAIGSALLALFVSSVASAATAGNARSPLGMNLMNVRVYSPEQPFLNIFKTSWISKTNPQSWQTHRNSSSVFDTREYAYIQTDTNGYPTTLKPSSLDPNQAPFDSLGVLLLFNLGQSNAGTGPSYPAGQYVVLYDGEGSLAFHNDAQLVRCTPGRCVFNVATPTYGGGIDLQITATDPKHTGNYLRNIRLVQAQNESLLNSGAVFNPVFVNLMQNFRLLRGMQWLEIDDNGALLTNWAQRPQLGDAGWGGPSGTPIEALIMACNAVGADCWLNIPHMASDDYIRQMATLAHAMLGSAQKAYVEYSNEVWNTSYPQNAYAKAQGSAKWPSAPSNSDFTLNWYGMRVAQTCDIWKSVWGADASRVVCVMGAFSDIPTTAIDALNCSLWTGTGHAPCSAHGIGVVAIGPYFAYVQAQTSWTTAPDGGLAQLFAAINGGDLQTTSGWEAAYRRALAPYNLPFIAYEGGQTLVSSHTSDPTGAIKKLYIAANRDPRMGAAYTTALNNWRSNGGEVYTVYGDIYKPSEWGEWGALESLWDTLTPLSNAPPKWQALQNFIAANNCWWANCAGTIGSKAASAP